jgi:hypothetical protein
MTTQPIYAKEFTRESTGFFFCRITKHPTTASATQGSLKHPICACVMFDVHMRNSRKTAMQAQTRGHTTSFKPTMLSTLCLGLSLGLVGVGALSSSAKG